MREGEYAETWSAVRRWTPREVARHAALTSLAAWGRASGTIDRALARPRVHLLYFHHVFPDEETGFRRLLDSLAPDHAFVPYSEAIDRIRRGAIDRRYVAFSFDDGLGTCVRAASILREYGATGCFFVCPPMLEERPWRDVAEFCGRQLAMPPTRFMTWKEVEELLRAGHEIGSHTLGHRNLAELPADELRSELEGSRDALRRRLGGVEHFAWPFGRFFHMSAAAVRGVFDAGYATCASAERGCHVAAAGSDPRGLCVRRDMLVAAWPLGHQRYLAAKTAELATPHSNGWPAPLQP